MEEREGFIKDSKLAIKGVLNGVIGAFIYEIIIVLFISMLLMSSVASKNPNLSELQLQELVDIKYKEFPFSILISCLTSLVTLIVFVFILKWEKFKGLCKKAVNMKVLRNGAICAFCIMVFSILYNSLVEGVFKLGENGNANQENVVSLIKSNLFWGFISVVVLAPLVEELTYRYFMFGGLIKYKRWIAYIVTAIVFMSMHGVSSYLAAGGLNNEFFKELVYLPPYLFSGLALAYVYDRTNNIGSSTLAHALNNFVSFLAIVCL